jgi:hypothetical protein
MTQSRRGSHRVAIRLAIGLLIFCSLAMGLSGLHLSRAGIDGKFDEDEARQVTVFGVIATPGSKTADSNLANIHNQLDKLLPRHGFRLLDAQSKVLEAGESVTCKLNGGLSVVTSLVKAVDENGKVQLRCELFRGEVRQFSTLVKTPLQQLFFCQRVLEDGSQLLIGVGARSSP